MEGRSAGEACRNRNRVEFKDQHVRVCICSTDVEIETEWNLKVGTFVTSYAREFSRNRNRVEFKGLCQLRNILLRNCRNRNRVEFKVGYSVGKIDGIFG